MLREATLILTLCLILVLFGCGQPTVEPSTKTAEITSTNKPASEAGSSTRDILGKWYSYSSGAKEGFWPVLSFNEDGSFHFYVNLYVGMENLYGTYQILETKPLLTIECNVTSTNSFFYFTIDKNTLICSSSTNVNLGVTQNGSIFERERSVAMQEQAGLLEINVRTNSMAPIINAGDTIIVQPCQPEEVQVGDVITFNPNPNDLNSTAYLSHRVVRILDALGGQQGLFFVTKGDHNLTEDPPITGAAIIGKVIAVAPANGAGRQMIS